MYLTYHQKGYIYWSLDKTAIKSRVTALTNGNGRWRARYEAQPEDRSKRDR